MSNKVIYRQPTYKVSQWLQILKEPWRSKAIKAWMNRPLDGYFEKDSDQPNIHNAIDHAFPWIGSDAGCRFWMNLHMEIQYNQIKYIQPQYHWVFKAKIRETK